MPSDPRDTLDLSRPVHAVNDSRGVPSAGDDAPAAPGRGRRFLMLYFRCANQYARAYTTRDGTRYEGRCPTCGKTIGFAIGQGGTNRRSFEVSCQ